MEGPFAWAIIGGIIVNMIAQRGKDSPLGGAGIVAGIVIFIVLVIVTAFIPVHVIDEPAETVQLLPQDDSGTLLFGIIGVTKSYSMNSGYSYDIQKFYLYRDSKSSEEKIISADTKTVSSRDDRGLIVTYNKYKTYDFSPWYYQLFYFGVTQKEESGTFKVIYVPNGTIKISPESIFQKGSFIAS